MSVGEPNIGRHNVSDSDVNEIARDQVFGWKQLPLALAQYSRFHRQILWWRDWSGLFVNPVFSHRSSIFASISAAGDRPQSGRSDGCIVFQTNHDYSNQ
jgi:hypothetical protein